MYTLTKMALGMIGQLIPARSKTYAVSTVPLAPARTGQDWPLMRALQQRQSQRAFDPAPLEHQVLSDLLWATAGVNRPDVGGRTAPSAMNAQNACLYCAGAGLATVIRAWIDRHALTQAMGLSADEQVLVAQTVGLAATDAQT